ACRMCGRSWKVGRGRSWPRAISTRPSRTSSGRSSITISRRWAPTGSASPTPVPPLAGTSRSTRTRWSCAPCSCSPSAVRSTGPSPPRRLDVIVWATSTPAPRERPAETPDPIGGPKSAAALHLCGDAGGRVFEQRDRAIGERLVDAADRPRYGDRQGSGGVGDGHGEAAHSELLLLFVDGIAAFADALE